LDLNNLKEDEKDSKTDREMKSTLFLVNIVLTTKVKKLQEEKDSLRTKLKRFESGQGLNYLGYDQNITKQKRKRKKKDQVKRDYHCKIGDCGKSYGTENSLNQHMKLKHIGFWNKIKEKEKSLIKPKNSVSNNGINTLEPKKNNLTIVPEIKQETTPIQQVQKSE
jgi:hypothetical protein